VIGVFYVMTPEPALMKAAGHKWPRPSPNAVPRKTAREPSLKDILREIAQREGERFRDSEKNPAKKPKVTQTPEPTVFDDVVNNDLFD
jgi:hypothetical protein